MPARRVERGTYLAGDDVEKRWLPEDQVTADTLRDRPTWSDVRHATRSRPAGRCARPTSPHPSSWPAGKTVTLLYASDGLELSAAGEALDGVPEGDTVRVLNPDSRQVRKGLVVGRKQVRVEDPRDGALVSKHPAALSTGAGRAPRRLQTPLDRLQNIGREPELTPIGPSPDHPTPQPISLPMPPPKPMPSAGSNRSGARVRRASSATSVPAASATC